MLALRAGALVRAAALRASRPAIAGSPRQYAASHHEEPDYDLANYPTIPERATQTLPPTGWDDVQMRRNFNDPVQERHEMLSMWGPDPPVVPPSLALRHFSVAVLTFVGFGFIVNSALTPEPPMVRRTYPYDGLQAALSGQEETRARVETVDED